MKKFLVFFLVFLSCIQAGPSEEEIQELIDEAVEEAISTTTSITTTTSTTIEYAYSCQDWSDQVNMVISSLIFFESSSTVNLDIFNRANISKAEMIQRIDEGVWPLYGFTVDRIYELEDIENETFLNSDQKNITQAIKNYLYELGAVWAGITNFLNDDPYSVEDTNNSILKTDNYQSELIVLIGDFKSLDYEFKNFCDI